MLTETLLVAIALRRVPYVQGQESNLGPTVPNDNNLATQCPIYPLLNHSISVTCYFTSHPVATALTFIRVIHNLRKYGGEGRVTSDPDV
jgi:hypothetical protein